MPAPYLQPVRHVCAWKGGDAAFAEQVTWQLDATEVAWAARLADRLEADSRPAATLAPDDHDLGPLGSRLDACREDVLHGHGLALIRGLPVADHSLAAMERLYWLIGARFGVPVSQSVMGDRIGHVTDVSGKDPNERAYRNSLELPLHTDISDVVAMLSLRRAREGGLSLYSSVANIHNQLLATRPDLLEPLYRGYRMHLFGEQAPGAPPVTEHPVPVLSERDGVVSARIVPEYVDMAEVELGEPMPPLDREALDTFLAIAHDPKNMFRVMLEPGDLTFINNYAVLHARTLFNDWPEEQRKRLLLRLWIRGATVRPLHQSLLDVARDGIEPQASRANSYFSGETAGKANRGRYGAVGD